MRGFIFTLFLFSTLVNAQTEYPLLNYSGRGINSIVPDGWEIIASSEGDLNKDDLNDFVVVVQKNVNIEKDGIVEIFILRILGIYLQQKDGMFVKHTQSNSFIISKENQEMNEPFQGIYITKDGSLDINFQLWKTESLWFITTHSFRFSLLNNKFSLIQYSLNETNREKGDTTDYILNFLTKKMLVTNGNFLKDVKTTEEVKKLKVDKLHTIESLVTPFKISLWD